MNPMLILAASDPIAHVIDKPILTNHDGSLWWVSNVSVMLVLSALATLALILPAARRIRTGEARTLEDFRTEGISANLVESICLYLRDEVFRPVLGDDTDKYTPVLWTFFWFILICNLMGLIPFLDATLAVASLVNGEEWINSWHPYVIGASNEAVDSGKHSFHGIGGTATQSIWVTGALATVAFVFVNGTAFVKDPIGFCKHQTAGAPWFMWPIMIPVEIMAMFVKPVALALRLFANMTGGHIIIAVLLSFVPALIYSMGTAGYGLALLPLLGTVAINFLEVMVAFIQAYIFTFLSCLFLGQLVVHEHEEGHGEHGEEHAHAHAHGAEAHAH